ncbi:protein kinase domain-containing protein [Leptospira meyeri]|uniref:protein kinase domain-containing protein n=1 Tax=Leptospira meyeri TaxID=29508 RepID=UPI000C2A2D82|nr:AAA family ATPase [Leptospira meyeri]PJZ79586.1 histidine kinase [Leptospira meyeri]PJZ96010.1 histidine kinase [Leptospira meyeri]
MFTVGKYKALRELHLGKRSSVYSGESSSGEPVVIKLLNRDYPDNHEITRFKNEFEILRSIDSPYTLRPLDLETYQNTVAIVFPNVGFTDLAKLQLSGKYSNIATFLNISIEVCKALVDIHKAKIVHNDIKAQNIIYNPDNGALKIIDFGSATLLTHRSFYLPMNQNLTGTLAHISPEQTGRMNRTVDYRTDFYSFGVTLYQLITGDLPFLYTDSLEMVHAHLAKTPLSPKERSGAPKIVSDLIMKLLEKNPEDRYQTATGLLSDLSAIQSVLLENGRESLNQFQMELAKNDKSSRFQIPKKLYGRESQLHVFEEKFLDAKEGRIETFLISGRSGIGKSALINEIQKPVTREKAYFASGKFDLYKKSIPYRAINLALQGLVRQLLSESESAVKEWKKNLSDALGANAKLIIDVVPELSQLLGDKPTPPELDSLETENRFHLVFRKFLRTICTKEHPVVLFLDDMQWADSSSILLLKEVLTDPEISYFFIILSYRDNEVFPTDPFFRLLEELREIQIAITEIRLEPLRERDVALLVSETLMVPESEIRPIAEVLWKKTKGNPFHVNEMFKNLYERSYIYFADDHWSWDKDKIDSVNISDNVIDLIIDKINLQSAELIDALKLTACIGNWFRHDIYATIADRPFHKASMDLVTLANEEFLILGMEDANFTHDKIREAIYKIISPEEKAKLHYKIGKTYLSILYKYKLEDHLFTIVNQLNLGASQMKGSEELAELRILNEKAGFKALNSSAYDAAFTFFDRMVGLMKDEEWKSDYENTLKLHLAYARSAYLSKNFEAAEKSFNYILSFVRNDLDKILVYELQSSMLVTQNKMKEVLETLKQALKLVGVRLPKKANSLSPLPELIKFKFKLGNRSIESLEHLPISNDPKYLAIMRLLNACIAPSFLAEPDLFPVIVLKLVNHTLRFGLCEISAFGFCAMGVIQGSGLGNYDDGFKFGQLGVRLLDTLDAKPFQCRTLFMFACMISPWKNHARDGRSIFWDSFLAGMETGDLQYSSYSLNNIHFQGLLFRENLEDLYKSQLRYDASLLSLRQNHAYQVHRLNLQLVENMRGESPDPMSLEGRYFSESETVSEWLATGNANALFDYYLCKLRIEYFLGDKEKAYEYSLKLDGLEGAMFGMMFVPEHVFLGALVTFSLIVDNMIPSGTTKSSLKKRLVLFGKRMKVWAKSSPENFSHKYEIISALLLYLANQKTQAVIACKAAISSAREYSYILEEAIANEFLVRMWKETGFEQYSNLHLVEAHYRYGKYGFLSKVKQLELSHISLKKYIGRNFRTDSTDSLALFSTTKDIFGDVGSSLDINTVIKASQTISGEIQLNRLLEKMMKILIENAGAERGYFILKSDSGWQVLAESEVEKESVSVYSETPFAIDFLEPVAYVNQNKIPSQIIGYVVRTGLVVICGDAAREGDFKNDPYVKSTLPKSLLCYPILSHGTVVGIVYLENNLTTDAFTPGRVEILKILSSQIAVSIENSLLYTNLEQKVDERTKELNFALTEVQGLKEQQDGDYFLASLLIEPLTQNLASSSNMKIQFLTEQKKKFSYKQWSSEIGGDLCVSSSIQLQNKKYIVVLNGDAMGKSMQGASGALVIGSVFEAIIKRNGQSEEVRDITPEKWVSNAYMELHNTLVTFDGSMLISMFLCLIDDETGFFYFLNAEHPRPVIYRNDKTFFLPHNYVCAKLGLLASKKALQINTFQLEKGDVLLIGSDGRDDILIGSEAEMEVNEDDELFLKTTFQGQGDLEAIRDAIKSHGELIDDLSLIRVEYTGEGSPIHVPTNHPKHFVYLRALTLYKQKKWKEVEKMISSHFEFIYDAPLSVQKIYLYTEHRMSAFPLEFAVQYVQKNPSDSLTLFYIAEALYENGDFSAAFDYSERVQLRRPYHKENNILFARLLELRRK